MLFGWNMQITAEIRNNYIFIQPFLEFVMKSDSVSCVLVPKAYRPYTSAAVEHSDQQGKVESKTKQQQSTAPPTEQQTLWKHLIVKGQSGHFRQSEVEQLSRILKTLSQEVCSLNAKLQSVQKRMAGLQSRQMQADHPKKKIRRRACQIQKNYKCTYEGCSKSYGSQISLNLHIKLKHKQHGTDSAANSKHTDQESSGSHIESHQSSQIRNMSSN